MRLSIRQRTWLKQQLALPVELAGRKWRELLHRDQHYAIGGLPCVLPPGSRLPFYQRRDPTYDTYAAGLIAAAAATTQRLRLIDVGANVGDTALMAMACAPNVHVVAVEGSRYFAAYARRNLAPFGDRVRLVERFVGPLGPSTVYRHDGSTGGLAAAHLASASEQVVTDWVAVAELVGDGAELTVWKSDIDGLDISLLAQNWDTIAPRCPVVWFEFDPAGSQGPPEDTETLISLMGGSGRDVFVYDNQGHLMTSATGGPAAARLLAGLTAWLVERRQRFAPVVYVDVWAVEPKLARQMWPAVAS